MRLKNIHCQIILSAVFAVILYCLCAFKGRAAMSNQEQLQLFLLNVDYLTAHLKWPGGMATYCAEFLVQFYNNFWIGSAVIAIMLVAIQILTWKLSKAIWHKEIPMSGYVLTFAPALLLLLYMGDINVMPTLCVALLMSLLTGLFFTHIHGHWSQDIFAIVIPPIFYWLFGTSVYLLLMLVCMSISLGKDKTYLKVIFCIFIILYTVLLIFISSRWLPYPMTQILTGINYYRIPIQFPLMQMVVMASFVIFIALSIATGKYRHIKAISSNLTAAILAAILAGLTYAAKPIFYDAKIYELMEYEYHVRTNNWQKIIQLAEKKNPDLPMSVCATNLALGMTGQLTNRAFDFYQNGAEGLLPPFLKETNSSMVTGEALFCLGLINASQQYYFEAMEAIANFNKSSRCIKRLAETNLIRGNYEVARKYLRLLQQTIFYKKWANKMMELTYNPQMIDIHPLYGKLRHNQIDDDFLFSDAEQDKIMGQLYLQDTTNRLALQYMLMFPLLQRDIDKFMQYLQVTNGSGETLPLIVQQGIAFAYMKANQNIPNGVISEGVHNQLKDFARVWTQHGKDSPEIQRYKNTLWYYLLKDNNQ